MLPRFDATERLLHWSVAALVLVLLATGVVLYVPSLSLAVGHRGTVVAVHVLCGLALPVLLGGVLLGSRSQRLRQDLASCNLFTEADRAWLRPRGRARPPVAGKFNAGQKLAAAVFGGSLAVMVLTGLVMTFPGVGPLSWATGATFVHDVVTVGLGSLVLGHTVMALAHPETLRGMLTGRVRASWAQRALPGWAAAVSAGEPVRPPRPPARRPARGSGRRTPPG